MELRDLHVRRQMLETFFASLDDVIAAYLFGSVARGRAGPLSDVDVAVLLAGQSDRHECFEARLEITAGLQEILQVNAVDVAILNRASPALCYRILREGILLYCRDRRATIEFTAGTVSRYLDFKPVIDRHERAILERAAKGELLNGYNPHCGTLERYRRLRERLESAPAARI